MPSFCVPEDLCVVEPSRAMQLEPAPGDFEFARLSLANSLSDNRGRLFDRAMDANQEIDDLRFKIVTLGRTPPNS